MNFEEQDMMSAKLKWLKERIASLKQNPEFRACAAQCRKSMRSKACMISCVIKSKGKQAPTMTEEQDMRLALRKWLTPKRIASLKQNPEFMTCSKKCTAMNKQNLKSVQNMCMISCVKKAMAKQTPAMTEDEEDMWRPLTDRERKQKC